MHWKLVRLDLFNAIPPEISEQDSASVVGVRFWKNVRQSKSNHGRQHLTHSVISWDMLCRNCWQKHILHARGRAYRHDGQRADGPSKDDKPIVPHRHNCCYEKRLVSHFAYKNHRQAVDQNKRPTNHKSHEQSELHINSQIRLTPNSRIMSKYQNKPVKECLPKVGRKPVTICVHGA